MHLGEMNVQTYSGSDLENEASNLNESSDFNLTNVDFQKYDKMLFNPLRFEHNTTSKAYNDVTRADNILSVLTSPPNNFGKTVMKLVEEIIF